jgi:hypothetical protein
LRAVGGLGLHRVDPVRWRTICYVLSDTFDLKLKTLEAMTLQSLHRARVTALGRRQAVNRWIVAGLDDD